MYASYYEYNIKYPKPLPKRYLILNKILGTLQSLEKRIFQKNRVFWSKNGSTEIYTLSSKSCAHFHKNHNLNIIDLSKVNISFKFRKLNNKKYIILPSALEEQNIISNSILCDSYIYYLMKKKYLKFTLSGILLIQIIQGNILKNVYLLKI